MCHMCNERDSQLYETTPISSLILHSTACRLVLCYICTFELNTFSDRTTGQFPNYLHHGQVFIHAPADVTDSLALRCCAVWSALYAFCSYLCALSTQEHFSVQLQGHVCIPWALGVTFRWSVQWSVVFTLIVVWWYLHVVSDISTLNVHYKFPNKSIRPQLQLSIM